MLSYKDKTWCVSANCKNKCGRKLTNEETRKAQKWWGGLDFPVAVAVFCDDKGEVLND